MWFLLPLSVTLGAFWLAYRLCDGEPTRSPMGAMAVGLMNIILFAVATLASLLAWLIYFIVN